MAGGYMNPSYGKMMEGHGDHERRPAAKEHAAPAPAHGKPSIHIHSHAKGHTVHILHKDGGHEKHEHPHGDAEGIAQHIHDHLGGDSGTAPDQEEDFGLGDMPQ